MADRLAIDNPGSPMGGFVLAWMLLLLGCGESTTTTTILPPPPPDTSSPDRTALEAFHRATEGS